MFSEFGRYPDIQSLIDEVKEKMLETGANLEEAKNDFEKRLISMVMGKSKGDEAGTGKLLEMNMESLAS